MHSLTHSFSVTAPERGIEASLRRKIDRKTKPVGALGRLEGLALRIGLMQQRLDPVLSNPHMLVFAADHGIAKDGVSAFPQEVTWQMVENFLAGGAAINVFARQNGFALTVVDVGVAHDLPARERLIDAKVAAGTKNCLEQPAMTAQQCAQAIACGADIVRRLASDGCTVVGFGEMGIGNTSAASLLTHALTGVPLTDCIGRGTGLDDASLARKRALLAQAWERFASTGVEPAPLTVLTEFGGFEIAAMVGAMLAAAEARMVLLIDGFIVSSAALIASRLAPAVRDYAVFCHRSSEPGHRALLQAMDGQPLLDLGLRLGEGTGAALAYPLVRAAVGFLNEMASFESAGVADRA